VREQLRAVRSQQRAQGGNAVVVVLSRMPAWAAAPAGDGCGERGAPYQARALRPAARAAYGRLIASLLALGRDEGVELPWWSAWNEPNHPGFLVPQRARCSVDAPTLAPRAYVALVRELRAQLEAAPGAQQVVLGELAGYVAPRPVATAADEFARALPRDVVCAAPVWAQHAYVRAPRPGADFAADPSLAGSTELLQRVERALDAHGCPRRHRIWITETGTGGARAGAERPNDPASLRAGCRALSAALAAWDRDPRVDAAFQYTFREDDLFPVGLADTALTRTYPAYAAWLAWSGGAQAASAASPSAACG